MADEVPSGPENKEGAKQGPEKKTEVLPVTPDAVVALEGQNGTLIKKYDDLKKDADLKKPPGYDPDKFPPTDQLKVPKLSWQKTGLKPLDILKTGGVVKVMGEAGDAIQAGPRREPNAAERIRGFDPTSNSTMDKPYNQVLGDRIDAATKPKILKLPPIKF